ncbi:MAG: thioredoxin domain-containing protein, partial [Polyangiales bacterium]
AGLADAWRTQRDAVVEQAERLTRVIVQESQSDLRGTLDGDVLDRARSQILASFDPTWGGFGDAPKFPHSGDIRLLLRCAQDGRDAEALNAAAITLERMARGGIFDQLGGGFHRYSTDERWCIPHFEKMLYDNALLVVAYLEAHLLTGNPEHARVAQECCDWALREMVTAEGGFASAQDADSEGEEGRFFAWTPDELFEVLGRRQGLWAATYFDVTAEGNFENGKSALFRRLTSEEAARELGVAEPELEASMRDARVKLLQARAQRVAPATDDKVLASWNGLMLSALCTAHQVLDRPRYLQAARRAASYVLGGMRTPDGGLLATARGGRAHVDACLDDYVFVTQGLIDLYESDFDPRWLREALALCELVEARFADRERGGYCTTSDAHEALIARTKTVHDGALPSGAGVQALNLLRLSELCGRPALREKAQGVFEAQAALANRHPRSFAALMLALDFVQRRPREIVISGEPSSDGVAAMLRVVRHSFLPQRVVALASHDADEALLPLVQGRKPQPRAASTLAYVCRDFRCDAPVSSPDALAALLRDPR